MESQIRNIKAAQHPIKNILNINSLQVHISHLPQTLQRQREWSKTISSTSDVLCDRQHEVLRIVSINGFVVTKRIRIEWQMHPEVDIRIHDKKFISSGIIQQQTDALGNRSIKRQSSLGENSLGNINSRNIEDNTRSSYYL